MEEIMDAIDYNSTDTNGTDADGAELKDLPLAIAYFVLSFIGLVANALVIYMFLRCSAMRSVSHIYIFSLALGDALFMCNFAFKSAPLVTNDWPFGDIMCKFGVAAGFTTSVVSVLFVMVMSIDRSVVLYRPLISTKYRKPLLAILISAAVWAVSLVFAVPRIVSTYVVDLDGHRLCVCNDLNFLFTISHFFVAFDLPVVVTCLCLFMIAVKAQPAVHPAQAPKRKGSDRSRMVAMLFLVYLLCCSLPLHMFSLYRFLFYVIQVDLYTFSFLARFLSVMSAVKCSINPILYWYFSDDFRKSFQRSLCCRDRNHAANGVKNKKEESRC